MPVLADRYGDFWNYLLPEQRELLDDCEKLIQDAKVHPKGLTDYSYIVFPVAKMYEGFLKKLFLDLEIINAEQYQSDHFRIGKTLNPNLEPHLRIESVYDRVCQHFEGKEIADDLWLAWKRGRNAVFHYFPGRLKRISFEEATEIVGFVLKVMEKAVEHASSKLKFLEAGQNL